MIFWEDRFVARCLDQLGEIGITIRQVRDLSEATELRRQLDPSPISPILDPARTPFTEKNSFWLFAEQEGAPILGGGVRYDDIGMEGFERYLIRAMPVIFDTEIVPCQEPTMGDIHGGRLVYFGDLKAKPAGGIGKQRAFAIKAFCVVGHYLSQKEYAQDVTWCFLQNKDYERRSHKPYGFLSETPFLHTWASAPFNAGYPEWVVYNSRDQYRKMMIAAERSMYPPERNTPEETPSPLYPSPLPLSA